MIETDFFQVESVKIAIANLFEASKAKEARSLLFPSLSSFSFSSLSFSRFIFQSLSPLFLLLQFPFFPTQFLSPFSNDFRFTFLFIFVRGVTGNVDVISPSVDLLNTLAAFRAGIRAGKKTDNKKQKKTRKQKETK